MSTMTIRNPVSRSFYQVVLNLLMSTLRRLRPSGTKTLRFYVGNAIQSPFTDIVDVAIILAHRETDDEQKIRQAFETCEQLSLPDVGDRVLCVWRKWEKKRGQLLSPYFYATLAPITACRVTEGLQVQAKNIWFEGGGIAHKECYSPGVFMGYAVKPECVEAFLRRMRWFTPEQRQSMYELVFPGQEFPA